MPSPRIALDGMGSDTHPGPEAEAAVRLAREFAEELILVGDESVLNPALKAVGSVPGDRIRLIHAAEVLGMSDKAAVSARGKSESSMTVGMRLVKDGLADAFVTAGNTGGAMAAALFGLGRLPGVKRPALAPTLPVQGGHALLIDCGANVDCKPEYLLQFAVLGNTYAQKRMDVAAPRVGLLSNGEEPGKGNDAVRAAYPLLEASGLNFIGNVEGRDFFAGKVDVLVADGFAGNVLLKTAEGVARFMSDLIARELTRGPLTIVGGLLAKQAFRRVRASLDPSEYGAVPLLGVNGLVFIGHGRSDAKAIYNSVRAAREAVEAGLLEAMSAAMGGGDVG